MNNVLPNSKNSFLLFLGVLLFCFVFSAGVRYKQFKTWEKTPAEYFVGEIPMMTTLDAPYWLRFAREYKQGTLGQKTGLRLFPENTFQYKKLSIPQKFIDKPSPNFSSTSSSSFTNKMHYSDVPLLGFIIAHFSSFFHNNYYLTGTLLIPFMSSLFILPLGIFFFQI